MAIEDKKDEKPIFDEDDKDYQAHYNIETGKKFCIYLFNAGLAPSLVHRGNLGVESINGQLQMYVPHITIISLSYHLYIITQVRFT